MQPLVDSQSARDELYRHVGRNVVNFQYLEATLRSMVPMLYNKVDSQRTAGTSKRSITQSGQVDFW